ncbi:MAG: hypothetical protein AAGB93_05155 [Planctomycetota bacterium]
MKNIASFGAPCLAASILTATAAAQAEFTPLATIDLDSTSDPANAEFIGSNPFCVAWNGVDLFVGGYNGSGNPVDVQIVRVTDALGAATFGTPFGPNSAPNLRGYIGLDISPDGVAAAFDDGGVDPQGITLWNFDGTLQWARSGRGGSGVAFDPGFPGGDPNLGEGVAWTTFGSGRRALQNTATGADIWDSSNGMIMDTGQGTFWRDMDFDDDSGDIYLREGNNLFRWERSGDNALTNLQELFDPVDQDFVSGQNVAYLGGPFTDYVIYNDRNGSAANQDFFSVVNLVTPTGAPVTVDWGSFSPPTGVALYDFSWDAASRTLAILDFANREVSIFSLDGGIGSRYCDAATNSTGSAAAMSGQGSNIVADNSLTLFAVELPRNSFAFFLTSQSQGFTTMPGGSQGNLCLSGAIGRYVGPGQIQNACQAGQVSLALDLTQIPTPTGFVSAQAGEQWNFTCWFRDQVGGMATSNFADGLQVDFQ